MFITMLYPGPSFFISCCTKKNVFHIFRHSSTYRRETYAAIRASINIAEINDVSVVACVIELNKIRSKKISIFVCIAVFCLNTSRMPET